jgi:signal peptidase I
MAPAISPGDRIVAENITFQTRQPHRGDIVVFKTDGIELLPSNNIFVKRVAGEPGDHIRISEGNLFINDQQVSISNAMGAITYTEPSLSAKYASQTNFTVLDDSFFVLGDNTTNSFDSRYWGAVPRHNIIGRVLFRYRPLDRVGRVK